ncbi:MAG: hypothetical protein ACLPV8_29790 [Steroidobacteraceae bacterium]
MLSICHRSGATRRRSFSRLAAAIAAAPLGLMVMAAAARADASSESTQGAASSTWLRCGAVWDGRGGKTLGATLIEVRAERIVSLRPASAASPVGEVIVRFVMKNGVVYPSSAAEGMRVRQP